MNSEQDLYFEESKAGPCGLTMYFFVTWETLLGIKTMYRDTQPRWSSRRCTTRCQDSETRN